MLLFATDQGYLDDIELVKINVFAEALLAYMHAEQAALLKKINEKGDYNEGIAKRLAEAISCFKTTQTW